MANIGEAIYSIAVVIPVYNGADFIADALESVLNQSYPVAEIVVVDDGSTDDTPAIIAKYARNGVRFVQQNRQGPSAARNRGIAETSAELIAFLDADDAWLPEKIRKQVELLVANPEFGLVSCGMVWFNVKRNSERVMMQGVKKGVNQRHEIAARNFVGSPSQVLVWRRLIDQVGGFDTSFRWCEDWELWTRLIDRQPAGFVHEPLMRYRWHTGGNTHNQRWEQSKVFFAVARRAASRVHPWWKRPLLLMRARSITEELRTQYAIQHSLPRTVQFAHAFMTLIFSPLENTSTKLSYCLQALCGQTFYNKCLKHAFWTNKKAKEAGLSLKGRR